MKNKTALQTVLDDIKLFEEHVRRSSSDADYYASVVEVLLDEKHQIESNILKAAADAIAKLPEDTKPTVVKEVVISEDELLRLAVAISVQKQREGGRTQVVKLIERGESISVMFEAGPEVDLTDAQNW
jgi:hypothetical protein